MKRLFFSFTIIFVFVNLLFAQEDKRMTIAITEFQAFGVSASEAAFVADFLRQDLVRTRAFKVVNRANMEQILAEQGLQLTGCTTQECAVRMGKLLNVNKMVTGTFGKLQDRYHITINLVDVETGEIIYGDKGNCVATADLEYITKRLAENLSKQVRGKEIIIERPRGVVVSEERIEERIKEKPSRKSFGVGGYIGKATLKGIEEIYGVTPTGGFGIGLTLDYVSESGIGIQLNLGGEGGGWEIIETKNWSYYYYGYEYSGTYDIDESFSVMYLIPTILKIHLLPNTDFSPYLGLGGSLLVWSYSNDTDGYYDSDGDYVYSDSISDSAITICPCINFGLTLFATKDLHLAFDLRHHSGPTITEIEDTAWFGSGGIYSIPPTDTSLTLMSLYAGIHF